MPSFRDRNRAAIVEACTEWMTVRDLNNDVPELMGRTRTTLTSACDDLFQEGVLVRRAKNCNYGSRWVTEFEYKETTNV